MSVFGKASPLGARAYTPYVAVSIRLLLFVITVNLFSSNSAVIAKIGVATNAVFGSAMQTPMVPSRHQSRVQARAEDKMIGLSCMGPPTMFSSRCKWHRQGILA